MVLTWTFEHDLSKFYTEIRCRFVTMVMVNFVKIGPVVFTGVGEGGRGLVPPPPKKKEIEINIFRAIIMQNLDIFSGKCHVKFENFVNCSCNRIIFEANVTQNSGILLIFHTHIFPAKKCLVPQSWLSFYGYRSFAVFETSERASRTNKRTNKPTWRQYDLAEQIMLMKLMMSVCWLVWVMRWVDEAAFNY